MSKVLDTLVAARILISDPNRWTKHASAKTDTNEVVQVFPDEFDDPANPIRTQTNLACFCADGALMKVAPDFNTYLRAGLELSAACAEAGHGADNTHITFNDFPGRTHEEVIAMFDAAIARFAQ